MRDLELKQLYCKYGLENLVEAIGKGVYDRIRMVDDYCKEYGDERFLNEIGNMLLREEWKWNETYLKVIGAFIVDYFIDDDKKIIYKDKEMTEDILFKIIFNL